MLSFVKYRHGQKLAFIVKISEDVYSVEIKDLTPICPFFLAPPRNFSLALLVCSFNILINKFKAVTLTYT